jgi:predicted ribosome quality control (RQC) complex YloA/Tae2 family protein
MAQIFSKEQFGSAELSMNDEIPIIDVEFAQKLRQISTIIKSKRRKIQNKVQLLEDTLEKNRQWQLLSHEALLLQSNIYQWKRGMKSIIVEDWNNNGDKREIILNPKYLIGEEVQKKMQLSKKQQRSLPHLEREISLAVDALKKLSNLEEQLQTTDTIEKALEILKMLGVQEEKKGAKEAQKLKRKLPYKEFLSESGTSILVGRRDKDNDILTFSIAHGSDYWLHVADYSGSHVIVKNQKDQIPDKETMADALQLALVHSRAKAKECAEIIITQCKFVRKSPRAAPGQVQISKHKREFINQSKERLQQIKKRIK